MLGDKKTAFGEKDGFLLKVATIPLDDVFYVIFYVSVLNFSKYWD